MKEGWVASDLNLILKQLTSDKKILSIPAPNPAGPNNQRSTIQNLIVSKTRMGSNVSSENAGSRDCPFDDDLAACIGLDRCCGEPLWPSGNSKPYKAAKLRIIKGNVLDANSEKSHTVHPVCTQVPVSTKLRPNFRTMPAPKRPPSTSNSSTENFIKFERDVENNLSSSHASARFRESDANRIQQQKDLYDVSCREEDFGRNMQENVLEAHQALTMKSVSLDVTPPKKDANTRSCLNLKLISELKSRLLHQ
jgi:hypothetical protein